jgi:uncharacterized protein (DUF1778 family)
MPATKTESLTCRITPQAKAALRAAAAREHRSLANMLEAMVLRYAAERPAERGGVPPMASSRARG